MEQDNRMIGQIVVFKLDGQLYAIPIEDVAEIIRIQPITKVPGIADYIEGVINLRGSIIPVIDLRKRFLMPAAGYGPGARIVITDLDEEKVGFLVEEIHKVDTVEDGLIQSVPDLTGYYDQSYFSGFAKDGDRFIAIIRPEQIHQPVS